MTYLDDGGTADVGYDGIRRAVKLRHLRSDDSLIVGFEHTLYDRRNNVLNENKLHDSANSESYDYDSNYRVISFDRAEGGIAPIQSQWNLDGAGNWSQVDAETRLHSSFNEIIQIDTGGPTRFILHDDNGNQIDDGELTFQWDFKDRLRTVSRKTEGGDVIVAV